MLKLFRHLKKYTVESIFGPLFKLLEALLELFVPIVVASIIDNGIAAGNRDIIVKRSILLAVMSFVGLGFSVTAQYFAAKASAGFAGSIRGELIRKISSLSHKELDSVGTSTLITRITADVNQVQNGMNMALRLLLRSPFVVFGSMIMSFTIDFKSAMIFVYTTILLFIVVFAVMLISIPLYKKVQGELDSVTKITRENLNGARVIRAFSLEDKQIEDFEQSTELLKKQQVFSGRISVLLSPLTMMIVNFAIIFLIKTGSVQVSAGALTQGSVVALVNYMSAMLVELVKLASLVITITRAIACANRCQSIFEIESSMKNGTVQEIKDAPAVVFDNVTFSYGNASAPSAENISFEIRAGECVGMIGATGSGKSTIADLIPRFYDTDQGTVSVFGTDVKEYDISYLRSLIGVVPQKAVLFKGTVGENIRWGMETADDDEVMAAVRTAQAENVVESKGGLDGKVESGGKNLSGGQKQRLCIARALVKKPKILILDDSSSALDQVTDKNLRSALHELDFKPAMLIISQKISTVSSCERIIVLDDGKIAGIGTHSELVESCEVYREMYEIQS